MFRDNFDRNFNQEFKSMKKGMVGFGFIALVLNLVFWLGLIAGGLWLLKHFGVF
jgi:hypothetical protein